MFWCYRIAYAWSGCSCCWLLCFDILCGLRILLLSSCLVPFGADDRETPLVVLSCVGGGVLVGQFVGADQRLWEWWRCGQMRSLGDETVLGVGEVFHLVDDAIGAGVQVVSLSHLSLGFGARVLQVSRFSGRDSVSGLVAIQNNNETMARIIQ